MALKFLNKLLIPVQLPVTCCLERIILVFIMALEDKTKTKQKINLRLSKLALITHTDSFQLKHTLISINNLRHLVAQTSWSGPSLPVDLQLHPTDEAYCNAKEQR